jgi:hypothetical protein
MTNFPLVKEVNFNDDQLLAIQNEQGIYAAVRRMCECIGFSQGQIRRQVDNIENDLVLSKGYANLRFPSNGGNQETTCILLNFLPL